MAIKPDDIDPSQLKRTLRGYNRRATDQLLEQVAFDYRHATHSQELLTARVAELEQETAAHEAEIEQLRQAVDGHTEREALVEAMLATAQRTAQEIRDAAKREANETVQAAQQRAVEIERQAHLSIRQTTAELDRLRTLESDLRTRLRQTLEAALGDQ